MAVNTKTDLTVQPYKRATAVSDPKSLGPYVTDELRRLERTLNDLTDGMSGVTDVAPDKPRRGMQRYAINPWAATLTGEGLYVYKSTGWTKII